MAWHINTWAQHAIFNVVFGVRVFGLYLPTNVVPHDLKDEVHVSVRGTRLPFHRKQSEVVDDFTLNVEAAGIF